jgi:pimeloyl-ACP methyl ester carboxylesterase
MGSRLRRSLWFTALAGLMLVAGCHTVQAPEPCVVDPCRALPQCCHDHVHIFIVSGMDPLDWSDLRGLREYFISLGFNNTYYGQFYTPSHYVNEVRRVHHAEPEARFVLVGFSFGANAVRYVANKMKEDDIPVELLVYLGGNTLDNSPRDRPENVKRILNILSLGAIWNGANIDGAENMQLRDVYHFGSASHPYTVDLVTRELAIVASGVPVIDVANKPSEDGEPSAELPAEWQFLKPAERLQPAPEKPASRENAVKPHSSSR